jgi:pyridoxine 5-phosphate synthase
MTAKLNVNIDHIATVRQARQTIEPSVISAALICEQAGADGITVHLRSDRRHIQDADVKLLRECVATYLNVEMAATEEMLKIAVKIKPDAVTLVPETTDEITTTGGLDVIKNISIVRATVKRLREHGIFTSIFVDPDEEQIEACSKVGAQQIELCTAKYAEFTLGSRSTHGEGSMKAAQELRRLRESAHFATQFGLIVAAGHGLTSRNVHAVAEIAEIKEFNIGHHIISRALFVGLDQAVKEMLAAIR